jgi:hypothetical protein
LEDGTPPNVAHLPWFAGFCEILLKRFDLALDDDELKSNFPEDPVVAKILGTGVGFVVVKSKDLA